MICSMEEFLLLLQKWMSSSQSVVFQFSVVVSDEEPEERTLSGTFMGRICGRIGSIDEHDKFFVIVTETDTFVMVGFAEWYFGYSDQKELSETERQVPLMSGEVGELITLNHANGLRINMFTLK